MTGKKGILLVNLGTPDSPSVSDVRKYLREFLMDKRVIDIPYISRWFLVNLIIATFRGLKSAKEYKKLWDERGSPLKYYSEDLTAAVQKGLGDEYKVVLGMRYQSPSLPKALEELRKANAITVIPLFPHYASASTGSVQEAVMRTVSSWQVIPDIKFVSQFFDHSKMIEAFAINARKLMASTEYDHFLFSYHGLPERHIMDTKINSCNLGDCCNTCTSENQYCYRAQCYETTRLLATALNLPDDKISTSFQSRLGKDPWIKPYTDIVLKTLAEDGNKKILAFSPTFVADCLETTFEVGETYKNDFISAGGEQWDLVESLNANPKWVECVTDLARF